MEEKLLKKLYQDGLNQEYSRLKEQINLADFVVLHLLNTNHPSEVGLHVIRDQLVPLVTNGFIAVDHILRLRGYGLAAIKACKAGKETLEEGRPYLEYFDGGFTVKLTELGVQIATLFARQYGLESKQ